MRGLVGRSEGTGLFDRFFFVFCQFIVSQSVSKPHWPVANTVSTYIPSVVEIDPL